MNKKIIPKSKNIVWKDYEKNEISHSVTHYLFAIEALFKKHWYARAVDIAKKLEITAWSCSIGIKWLLKKELIVEDEHKMIQLSEKGKVVVVKISQTREIFEKLFHDVIWVSSELAVSNACKIEHLIDNEVTLALEKYITTKI